MSASPLPCWDFVWLASLQVLCMLSASLWVHMCIKPIFLENAISLELSTSSDTWTLSAFFSAQIPESWGKRLSQTSHRKHLTFYTLSSYGSLNISPYTARRSFSDKVWVIHLSIALSHLETFYCYVCFQTFYIKCQIKIVLCFAKLRVMVSVSQLYNTTVGRWR